MKPSSSLRSFTSIFALAGLSLASGCDDEPVVLQDSPVAEHAYEELAQMWVQWASAAPFTTGPIMDPTGDQCAHDQHGKVWFLAGTWSGSVERTCTIPADKALFFPLVNRWVLDIDDPIDDEDAMDALVEFAEGYFANNRANTCVLTLRLDGEDMLGDLETLDEELFVQQLDPFVIDVNDDNWATQYGLAGGPYPAVTGGHYALLRPLEPGEHTLELGGATCDANGNPTFQVSATYHLTVEE